MRWPLTFYSSRFIPDVFAGFTRGPVILIRPEYRADEGLYRHELEHVRQWFATLGVHSVLYLVSRRYRLWAEVAAYKVQLKFAPENDRLFAWFIAENHDLSITQEDALQLLQ